MLLVIFQKWDMEIYHKPSTKYETETLKESVYGTLGLNQVELENLAKNLKTGMKSLTNNKR